jgi:hypothetical protein
MAANLVKKWQHILYDNFGADADLAALLINMSYMRLVQSRSLGAPSFALFLDDPSTARASFIAVKMSDCH